MKRRYFHYNPWFVIPVIIWALVGGIILFTLNRQMLFHPNGANGAPQLDVVMHAINIHHTTFLDYLMYGITSIGNGVGITIILLLLWLCVKPLRNWRFFLLALACNAIPALIIEGIKHIAHAPRPFNYYHDASWIHFRNDFWGEHLMDNSFPSGHSAGAFSMYCFFSLIIPRKYAKVGLLFFFIALLTGYSRMYVAAHFYLDVYVGSIIGSITTLTIFTIAKHWQLRKEASPTAINI